MNEDGQSARRQGDRRESNRKEHIEHKSGAQRGAHGGKRNSMWIFAFFYG